jgi:mono/diheme cytochrome c family protein
MMKKPILALTGMLATCTQLELQEPAYPISVTPVPAEWNMFYADKYEAKSAYIVEHNTAYQWFANFPFSETDGTPFILLKLLPKLAPAIWNNEDNFLEDIGLFMDERQPNFPAPLGIGFSGLSRQENTAIDYSSITCAACHVGRVLLPSGSYEYLDGGVNTRFNLPLMRGKITQTFELILGESVGDASESALAQATSTVLTTLEELHAIDPNYFYANFKFGNTRFDRDYESAQIDMFRAEAGTLIETFVERIAHEKTGYDALVRKNYAGIEQQMNDGIPGMADATGLMASNAYGELENLPVVGWFASLILPKSQGITDYMSVWEQDKRKASWSQDGKELVNGGGQWNGSIPIPIYRNIAAELTLGLDNTDVRVAAFAEELLDGLPASPYPFSVDVELANTGKRLFEENCAGCHQPHNGKVYDNLGTPMGRANVINWITALGARSRFYETCNESTTVELHGLKVEPCAQFENVSLSGKSSLIMRPVSQQRGYSARPLSGIWAQAPYLHNGSVPTLYHVLVANERPQTFLRGIEEYDQEKLGFVWKEEDVRFTESLNNAMLFDTNAIPALNSSGHSEVITDGDNTYKLDWSDDKEGASAILEYLKVL